MEIFNEETIVRWFSSKTDCDIQLSNLILNSNFEKKVPKYSDICNTLFRCDDLYENYKINTEVSSPMNCDSHIGDNTINKIKEKLGHMPVLGIEVGSFIGSSSLVLGDFLKSNNGTLICIDTWCGDINMWLLERFHETMGKDDGNPKIYDHFMNNMIDNHMRGTVIPFRVSSIVGARLLKVLNYDIDFIYVDSAHESGETFMELMLYHDILKNGGVLFGDDYYGFPAVKYDVDLFCKYFNYTLEFTGDSDTWIIQKK